MELKIKVHSLIDVITNSSTMVFITMIDGAVDKMHELIDEILNIAGSDKKSKDLFNIEIEQNWEMILDYYIDIVSSDKEYKDEEEKKLFEDYNAVEGWKEKEKFANNNFIPYLKETGRYKDYLDSSYGYNDWLMIKAKDNSKSTTEIWQKIRNLFDIQAIVDN